MSSRRGKDFVNRRAGRDPFFVQHMTVQFLELSAWRIIFSEKNLECYNTKAGKYREKRIVRATVRLSELLPVRTVLFPRGRIDL